jgi:hypothetical protein
MRIWIAVVALLAVMSSVAALDISDYPQLLNKGGILDVVFVIGDNAAIADAIGAVDIATSLQFYSRQRIQSATKLASEIGENTQSNLIVVGGPCANSVSAQLFGYPQNCMEGFVRGKAVIKLFERGDSVAIVVAGATASDTRRASRVLANFNDYDFAGTEVEVTGTSLKDVQVRKTG